MLKAAEDMAKPTETLTGNPPKQWGDFGIPFLVGLSPGIGAYHAPWLVMSQVEGFSPRPGCVDELGWGIPHWGAHSAHRLPRGSNLCFFLSFVDRP